MSRLGKSFKNKFLRRALAMVLAGTMVMTGMPISFAAESTETEASVETEVQSETEKTAEEAAEDGEAKQKESEEMASQEKESTKPAEESETVSAKESSTAKEDKETTSADSNDSTVSSEIEETETTETDTEEVTETEGTEEENEAQTSTYSATEGNSEALVKYNIEGFADSYGVTGGGLLKKGENDNYYTVSNEKEFLDALVKVRAAKDKPSVIEITEDMNLGDKELKRNNNITLLSKTESEKAAVADYPYCKLIWIDEYEPLMHPALKGEDGSGVSILYLQDMENLTIFSKNGSSIKHCGLVVKRVKNLIIRNLTFDELWEWDEATSGSYDRNDWDYIGIEQSNGIWIDHCTFYKSYDGIVDIKNPAAGSTDTSGVSNVTISWCRFLPASKNETFFNAQMDWLKINKESTKYYKELIDTDKATEEQVRRYAYGQKKTHLLGQKDEATNAVGIKLTLANNYYYDSMDRMPRLRHGTVHEYNCVLDSQDLYDWRTDTSNPIRGKITSNGASSNCNGKMLLENCYIKGINNPLISGNDKSSPGSINAVHSLYYMGSTDKTSELKPKNNNSDSYTGSREVITTNAEEFIGALPYKTNYQKYGADTLNTDAADSIKSLAGAGKLTDLSEVQWQKTSYGSRTITDPNPGGSETDPPETEPSEPSTDDEEMTIAFELNANDMTLETLATNTSAGRFTIKATSGSTVTVGSYSGNPIGGKEFTKRIQLGGSGAENYRSIHFTADKPGVLTVYAQSSGDDSRTLGLYKLSDTTAIDITQAASKDSSILKYNITESGNYYIKSEKSGIHIYYIAFSVKKTSEGEGETDPKNPPASYPKNTGKLDVEKLEAEEITTSVPIDDNYTLIGTADGAVTIKGITETTINEKTFTKAISLSGPGSAEKSAIAITGLKEGKLSVYANGTFVLRDASDETIEGTSTIEKITDYTLGAADTYYLYSSASSSDIYYIEFTEQAQGSSGDEITNTFHFRVDDCDAGTLTADLPVGNYFTVTTGSEITTGSKTVNEVSFTKCVKFGGKGNINGKSIQIKALGKGTMTVYAESGKTGEERYVTLLDSEGKELNKIGVTTAAAITFTIPEKGKYYISSGGSSIFVYGIDLEVTYKEGESFDEEQESDPTFTAPEGDVVYDANEGNEQSKVVYNIEGYAASANVTGGGLLKEESANYHKVTDEKEFLQVLSEIQGVTDKPNVIEITTDLNLGSKELNKNHGLNITSASGGDYSGVIRAYGKEPLMHPTLKEETGVSYIKLHSFYNLTIFSKNGAAIKHAGILFEDKTSNIIIRNITFDELWEWDDVGNGSYDENSWDYMEISEYAEGIWIDHCTFYKAYDGIIDMKNKGDKTGPQRVTISWCEFLPGSKNNTFFNTQMKWLEENKDKTTYYKTLRDSMSEKDVWWYAYGQKKTHLFGSEDDYAQDKAIRTTLANNYYKNSMDRMPRLRYGKVHEYNCVLDAQNLYTKKNSNSGLSSHITNQGAISTCNGEMLLENCYIRGIKNPLYSGNGSSPTGYNKAIGSVHYLDGTLIKAGTLEPIKNGSGSGEVLITDETKFKEALPYKDYITYDATQLFTKVVPYAGAGKLTMSTVQWEKTNYGSRTGNESSTTSSSPSQSEPEGPNDELPKTPWDETENPDNPPETDAVVITAEPGDGAQFPSTGGTVTLTGTKDAVIYYTTDKTDPRDETNPGRQTYEEPIAVTQDMDIWAVAVKEDKKSDVLTCHYTVAAEGVVVKPVAVPGSEEQPTAVPAGTKVTLSTTDTTIETIYYTTGDTLDAAADPREEGSGRQIYDKEKGITVAAAMTIKAAAQKDGKYSEVAAFTYTIKTDADPDPSKTVATPTFTKTGGAAEKGEKTKILCETEGADIYYTTDGSRPKAEAQFLYTPDTEIVIDKTMTIRAVAVKDGVSSKESMVTYTVKADPDTPSADPDIPAVKTIKLSECSITVPSIMKSTNRNWKPQSVTYVTYEYKNENGETKHVKFAEDIDYTVDWTPGLQADGTYKVVLTGCGRQTDGRTVDGYVIDKSSTESAYYKVYEKPARNSGIKLVDISKAKVSLKAAQIKNLYYTGYAYEPELDYTKDKDGLNGKLNITYKNNINAGKASVIISAKPEADTDTVKYVGSKTFTFTIKKAALNKDASKATASVSFDQAASEEQQYMSGAVTAKGLEVKTVVKSGDQKGVLLRKDEDYTVTYKNSVKNGKVIVTMTVKGVGNNLSGNCAKTFTMDQLDLRDIPLTEVNGGKLSFSANGAKLKTITFTKGTSTCTLKEGVDYTAKYEYDRTKKKDAGSIVKVTVKGKGVCKNEQTATFTIVQADFGLSEHIAVSEDVTVDIDELNKPQNRDKAKRTKVFEKAFVVKDAAGVKLNANKDYSIAVDEEKQTITITPLSTGKNGKNYTGTKTFSYRTAVNLAKDKNFIFDKNLEKNDPLVYDGRNPVKLTTADIDKYLNKTSQSAANYDQRKYRLGGKNANIEIVPGTYKNNIKKGTAQVTIRGIAGVDGGFYGQKVLKFKIVEK